MTAIFFASLMTINYSFLKTGFTTGTENTEERQERQIENQIANS